MTIYDTLKSLINQKGIKPEIIIVDNNSTDNTLKIIKKIKNKHHDIKIIRNKKNQGISFAIRKALKHSSYNYVCIVHDDIVFPKNNLISKGLDYLKRKNIICVSFLYFTPKEVFDKYSFWGKVYSYVDFLMEKKVKKQKPKIGYYIAAGKAVIFKKSVIYELNLYNDKRLKYGGEDVDIEIKIKNSGYKIVSLPFVYHVHANKSNKISHFLKKEYNYGKIAGTLSRIYNIKTGGGYGIFVKFTFYLGLLIPGINYYLFGFLFLYLLAYTYKITKVIGFYKQTLILPFYRILKDILLMYGYITGYLKGYQ